MGPDESRRAYGVPTVFRHEEFLRAHFQNAENHRRPTIRATRVVGGDVKTLLVKLLRCKSILDARAGLGKDTETRWRGEIRPLKKLRESACDMIMTNRKCLSEQRKLFARNLPGR